MSSSGGLMYLLENILFMLSTKEKKISDYTKFKVTEEDLYLV